MPKTISQRYKVIDRETGQEAKGIILLDPVNDPHARAGLWGYARSVEPDNYILANDLKLFVTKLNEQDRLARQISADPAIEEMIDWIRNLPRGKSDDNESESKSHEDS